MVEAIWPQFASFNHLPESADITSGAILMIVLYWFIQTGVSMVSRIWLKTSDFNHCGRAKILNSPFPL